MWKKKRLEPNWKKLQSLGAKCLIYFLISINDLLLPLFQLLSLNKQFKIIPHESILKNNYRTRQHQFPIAEKIKKEKTTQIY